MKKIQIILLMIVGCVFLSSAQHTQLQKKAKTEIFNALRKYGSNLTDDGEESISFKNNGINYEISVHTLNSSTLYLAISVVFGLPEDYNPIISNYAAYSAAGGKPVCSFATEGALAFSCEMYAKDAKPFIAVLSDMIDALESSVASFQEEYEKVAKEYNPTSHNLLSDLNVNNNEFIYPKTRSTLTDETKLYVKKVTLDPNYTILDMVSYNGAQIKDCTISKNAYLMANGKKYNLIKAEGITYNPVFTDYPGWESGREVSLNFKLFFSPLPKGTTTFDFMESPTDGWQIKGIELNHGNSYSIHGEKIDTPYHEWECNAIEIQNGQTILTKTVKPKSAGTFMYSSQDEYIEDADTGRKYYLNNSSIGFEGSPEISNDTKQIVFYEVYPALPENVKRINISSGSQYYVKDLKIR